MTRNASRIRLLLRTSAFQLTLVYAVLFLVSVSVLLGVLYWATIGSIDRQINATIESEILGLAEQYERQGLNGLVDVITRRVSTDTDNRAIYLLADANLNPVAGNLQRWPRTALVSAGRVEFETMLPNGRMNRYRASILAVGRSYRLLVGRDIRELTQLGTVFERTVTWGTAVTLLLALAGGILMSFSAQRRVASINRTARRIIGGDLSGRVPITGVRDEYDDLAININEMLTQIEILLDNVRHVGDSIAHDLKTPLTRLRNGLEMLASASEPVSPELGKCIDEADRLLHTFNALLRIARIESGAYRSEFSNVDLNRVVGGVYDLYRAAADEKNVSIEFAPGGEKIVYGDEELLAQAVVNLLDNATKYTPEGGHIDLDIEESAGRVSLSVSDSGPGVPSAELERIQQRFVRLDAARSKPGSGLGLSLVKAVAAQHRAEFELQNLGPGLKATLTFPVNGQIAPDQA